MHARARARVWIVCGLSVCGCVGGCGWVGGCGFGYGWVSALCVDCVWIDYERVCLIVRA